MRTPDVNVLLYAVNRDSPQHRVARLWLESSIASAGSLGFAWAALLGFIRISTRPGIFARPLPVEAALGVVGAWLNQPGSHVLHPTEAHASILGRLLMVSGGAGNLVSDAHLAAIAIEHGAIVGTFDRDFERFAGLRCELLR